MSISGDKVVFKYTDWTQKKQNESFNNLDFYTDRYIMLGDPGYKPIALAARKLCSKLEIDYETDVEIANGFQKTVLSTDKVLFHFFTHAGTIMLSTENDTAFSFEQIEAIFKFANTLIQHGWL